MRRDPAQLRDMAFDILIVGGGIHGAWVALRSAAAGYRVALIERDDFGGATSANSLNILHGGLRYLQHLDFSRMRSSIRARREFARRYPHLVRPLPCVMPLKSTGIRSPWIFGPALIANDALSRHRNRGVPKTSRLARSRLVSSDKCRSLIAPLTELAATAGAIWWDALSLDSARLSLEAVIGAARAGAIVANRIEATCYMVLDESVRGVVARDRLTGREFEIKASVVINATGPWAGEMAVTSGLPTAYLPALWVGALNVVLKHSYGLEAAVALPSVSKAADSSSIMRRATRDLFFVPWRGGTAVGTDYIRVASVQDCESGPPASMVDKFVAEIARVAPRCRVMPADVVAVHWGVLPGEAVGAVLPRKSAIVAAGLFGTGAAGLVVVIGDKLTSAPALSTQVLACAEAELLRAGGPLRHDRPKIRRGHMASGANLLLDDKLGSVRRLQSRYGADWQELMERYASRRELFDQVSPEFDVLAVEVVHAVREEMALGLDDILLRRLGLGGVGCLGMEMVKRCAEIAAPELGWTSGATDQAVKDFQRRLDGLAET